MLTRASLHYFSRSPRMATHYADLKLSDSEDGDAMESFAPDTAKIFLHAGLADIPSGSEIGFDVDRNRHATAPRRRTTRSTA